jgi:hypothetical protein
VNQSEDGHFSDEEWTDFVREVVPKPEAEQMLEHLNSGCVSCRDTVRYLQDLTRLGRTDLSEDVAAGLTARARLEFKAAQDTTPSGSEKGVRVRPSA